MIKYHTEISYILFQFVYYYLEQFFHVCFIIMYPIFIIEEVSKKDIKEMTTKKE